MAAIIRLNNVLFSRNLIQNTHKHLRLISTSQKNKDAAAAAAPTGAATQSKTETKTESKNWVSYGFDFRDEANDRSAMKASYFFSITLCLVWGTFVWSYLPDPQNRDWAQRAGYLALREREAAGLEPISPNYVDPSSISLPSDDELGDTEIII